MNAFADALDTLALAEARCSELARDLRHDSTPPDSDPVPFGDRKTDAEELAP